MGLHCQLDQKQATTWARGLKNRLWSRLGFGVKFWLKWVSLANKIFCVILGHFGSFWVILVILCHFGHFGPKSVKTLFLPIFSAPPAPISKIQAPADAEFQCAYLLLYAKIVNATFFRVENSFLDFSAPRKGIFSVGFFIFVVRRYFSKGARNFFFV